MLRHSLILLAIVSLLLAGMASGAVRKGEVELEVQGAWVIGKAEEGSIREVEGTLDFDEVLSGATGTDLDGWSAGLGLGRFVSDNLQLGIAGFYTQLDGDTETIPIQVLVDGELVTLADGEFGLEMTAWGIGGKGRWHFNPASPWVVYAGGQAFWVSADVDVTAAIPGFEDLVPPGTVSDSVNGILYGPLAGLRWEIGERNALLFEYQYQLWAGDLADVIKSAHGFFLGLVFQLN